MNIAEFQLQFTAYLQQWCERKCQSYAGLNLPTSIQALITKGIDLLQSDGKRVRPYIAYLAYTYHGGSNQQAIFQLGLVLEILHVFALIHDDWMDHGTLRRGKPTAHVFMAQLFTEQNRIGLIEHVAASQAVLLGDLVFSWVYQELNSLPGVNLVSTTFSQMVDAVVLGQMIDIDSTTLSQISREQLEQKMELKTASYTFVYPLQLGALLAGDQSLQDFYVAFGNALGLGFQIQDDLLDILSIDVQKTPFSDIVNHQHSLCTYYVLNHGTDMQKALLHQVWGRSDLTNEERNLLKVMFVDSGAIAFAQAEMKNYFVRTESLLKQWAHNSGCHQAMQGLMTMIANRLPNA